VSSLLFDAAQRLVEAQDFDARSTGVGLVAILLLIALLVEAEVLRGLGGDQARARVRSLAVVAGPLRFAFALIVGTRLAHLL